MKSGSAPPRVSVFMPVHNREHTLHAAIDSVLKQTFSSFELLLVDDGSTDRSIEIAQSYSDPRVRLVVHERNLGIPATRNHGLELARGEFLAILDSDDLAAPTRLQHQVSFLEANTDVAAVGSWLVKINRQGRWRGWILRPTRPRDIRARILFASCFKNPAMTARTDILRKFGYREEFRYCQDIDLWARVSVRHPLANIPRFLTHYRSGGESRRDEDLALRLKMQAARYQLEEFGLKFDDGDLARHVRLRNTAQLTPDREFVEWCDDWLRRILDHNASVKAFPEPELALASAERWLLVSLRGALAGAISPRQIGKYPWRGHIPACLVRRLDHGLRNAPPALASLVR